MTHPDTIIPRSIYVCISKVGRFIYIFLASLGLGRSTSQATVAHRNRREEQEEEIREGEEGEGLEKGVPPATVPI